MRIIKVNAINSTNEMAREFYPGNSEFEAVCISAFSQTKGKGQRGASWFAKPGENLTFSILYPKLAIGVNLHFLLSAAVALGILKALRNLEVPRLKLKWPNDIMSGNKKVGGILIENILKNDKIAASVIGVGLNVNQTDFKGLPQAGSLKTVTRRNFQRDELLESLLEEIRNQLENLKDDREKKILQEYENKLFRKDKVSAFELPDGTRKTGIIRGITNSGLLKLEVEDEKLETFDLKEIKLLF